VDFRKSGLLVCGHEAAASHNSKTPLFNDHHHCLGALSTDAAGQLNVFRHNGDTLGVDGAQVRVLEQANEVRLGSLLEGENGRSLEAKITLEVLSDLTNETLEGELPDEEIGALLVPSDLTKGDGSGPVTVGFLHASSGGGRLAGSFGRELLAGGFASGGLAGGLLGTCHFDVRFANKDADL
jgi:hypothetical protein